MSKRALTATQVAALKDHTVHWVAPSLYLQIRPQGTRSWLFRYSRNGENQWMGLGALADKPLSEARDEAAMLRVLVKRGGDPMGEKREVEATHGIAQGHEQGPDLRRMRRQVHRVASGRLEERQAHRPVGEHAEDVCGSSHRQEAGRPDHRRGCAEGPEADLDRQARDRQPASRPDREGARLGHGDEVPQRRQSCGLERGAEPSAAGDLQGADDRATTRRCPTKSYQR